MPDPQPVDQVRKVPPAALVDLREKVIGGLFAHPFEIDHLIAAFLQMIDVGEVAHERGKHDFVSVVIGDGLAFLVSLRLADYQLLDQRFAKSFYSHSRP